MRRWLIGAALMAAFMFVAARPAEVKAQVYRSVYVSPGYGYYGSYVAPVSYVSVAPASYVAVTPAYTVGYGYNPYYTGLSATYVTGWGGYGWPYYGYRTYWGGPRYAWGGWGGWGYGRGYRGWGGWHRHW